MVVLINIVKNCNYQQKTGIVINEDRIYIIALIVEKYCYAKTGG